MIIPIQLSRIQRTILIATAGIIVVLQLGGIADRGLDENRGWVWALLAAAGLLVLGLSPNRRPESKEGTGSQHSGDAAATKAPPADVMQRFARQMVAAGQVVKESERVGARLYEFVIANNLYHQDGALAWMLHPAINSVLAAHSLVFLAVDESKIRVDTLLWETYRTTLAHRLAERRAELFPELSAALGNDGKATKPDRAYVDLAKGEIKLWEDVAKRSAKISENSNRKYAGLLSHFAATFGGRKSPVDDTRFEGIVSECYADAKSRVVPQLTQGI